MIERFNFYDVYGYLIPGVIMTMLLYIPYGIATSHWPDTKFSSVAVVLVAAYLVGHFMQGMATNAVPSKTARDQHGKPAFPSDVMLNPSSGVLSELLRRRLSELVQARFKTTLDVTTEIDVGNADHDRIAKERNNIFFLCRPIVNKTSNYAEQFQGLYVLMRGVFVALLLALFYYLGWLWWFWAPDHTFIVVRIILLVSVVVSIALAIWRAVNLKRVLEKVIDQGALIALATALLASGEMLAERTVPAASNLAPLAAIAAFLPIAAFRFYTLYRSFATEFAKAVWTYFAAVGEQ